MICLAEEVVHGDRHLHDSGKLHNTVGLRGILLGEESGESKIFGVNKRGEINEPLTNVIACEKHLEGAFKFAEQDQLNV